MTNNLIRFSLTFQREYNPNDYEHLAVSSEIKQIFSYITYYTPQIIDIELKLKPFVPDYIPAVGDIDAFIKVNRRVGRFHPNRTSYQMDT